MLASSFLFGSFNNTSRAGFIITWEVSLTHNNNNNEYLERLTRTDPQRLHVLYKYILHIPCWLHFCLGSFSYTSRAEFIFIWGVSLTDPELASFLSGEFLLNIPCSVYFSLGVSLTHPMLTSFSFFFHLGSFSYSAYTFSTNTFYTSRAGFIFVWGVSLTHPVLA